MNLFKMKNRDYYWLLMKNPGYKYTLKGIEWQRDLQPHATTIDSFFSSVKYMSSDNKLREFYFKLLHRIVVAAKRELHSCGFVNDTLCIYCRENDSIIHTFCNCHWSKEFYSEVIKWFNAENVASLSLSPMEILSAKPPLRPIQYYGN